MSGQQQPALKIKLAAFSLDLYYAWRDAFRDVEEVEVLDEDIFQVEADAIVSPANSFGYMDGGLDLKISETLGWHVEERVRAKILKDHAGELPVGNALVVETEVELFPYLICAPTMRVPMDVSGTVNAYLAFKAILDCVSKFNTPTPRIGSVVCSGLGTGEGRMPAKLCALQMREAYEVSARGHMITEGGFSRQDLTCPKVFSSNAD